MKKILLCFFLLAISVFGQRAAKEKIVGKVDYISAQYYYVNFAGTDRINIGDTLFIKYRKKYYPKLIVEKKSSRSCATKLIGKRIKKGRKVYAFVNKSIATKTEESKHEVKKVIASSDKPAKIKSGKVKKFVRIKPGYYGKYSLSGYSNFSNIIEQNDYQHWRHSLSFYASNIKGSKLSFSSYLTFRYRSDQWNYVHRHLGSALKIYDFAVRYDFNRTTNFTVGRKINRKLSNIGAIDGLQLEIKYKGFYVGGILGSRPNIQDYGFNIKLLEMGVYVSREDSLGFGKMTNTLSIVQQMNNNTTDRRFFYFQHSSHIIKSVHLFFSSEVDFFKHYHKTTSHEPYLTNIFISLRYSPARWITLNTSYDARKNVIYYETYKSYIDRLIENAMRQGFRVRVNLRPVKYIFASVYTGYRFRKDDKVPTKNIGVSVTHSKIPVLNVSANISYINLKTNYLNGEIIGIRFSKDLFNGLLYVTTGFRNLNYVFPSLEQELTRNTALLDLSMRLTRKLSFSISYEGTFEEKSSYSNLFFNVTQRF